MSKKRPVIYNSPSNLDYPNLLLQNETKRCEPRYLIKQCACGRFIFQSSCMNKACLNCNPRLNSRRAYAAFNRFQNYKKTLAMNKLTFNYCYTDFTIPPVLRQKYADPKAWQKLRRIIWRILSKEFGALFGLEATHPIGEDNSAVFHPHLNFLYVLKDGFRNFIAVDRLRQLFQTALKYSGPVNLYHAYGNSDRQLMHLCKYITRIFPSFAKWAGALRWYGRYPKYKPITDCYCAKCQEKYILIGFVDRQAVHNYEEFGYWHGRDPPWERDREITFFKQPNLN